MVANTCLSVSNGPVRCRRPLATAPQGVRVISEIQSIFIVYHVKEYILGRRSRFWRKSRLVYKSRLWILVRIEHVWKLCDAKQTKNARSSVVA